MTRGNIKKREKKLRTGKKATLCRIKDIKEPIKIKIIKGKT